MEFDYFAYLWLPLMIFFARILDVTIGTIRIILIAKGHKYLAPVLGFVEVLIWIIAIGQIMENLDNWMCYLFYAGGFAMGNYIGMVVEEKIALGIVGLRLVTVKPATELVSELSQKGYGVTYTSAQGTQGPVNILFVTVSRKDLNFLIDLVNKFNPGAFYTVEDIRFVNKGIFKKHSKKRRNFTLRKGK